MFFQHDPFNSLPWIFPIATELLERIVPVFQHRWFNLRVKLYLEFSVSTVLNLHNPCLSCCARRVTTFWQLNLPCSPCFFALSSFPLLRGGSSALMTEQKNISGLVNPNNWAPGFKPVPCLSRNEQELDFLSYWVITALPLLPLCPSSPVIALRSWNPGHLRIHLLRRYGIGPGIAQLCLCTFIPCLDRLLIRLTLPFLVTQA